MAPSRLTKEEEDVERKANYESYRIIVENECAGCKFDCLPDTVSL